MRKTTTEASFLVLFASTLVISQTVWLLQGVARDFSGAPSWVGVSRSVTLSLFFAITLWKATKLPQYSLVYWICASILIFLTVYENVQTALQNDFTFPNSASICMLAVLAVSSQGTSRGQDFRFLFHLMVRIVIWTGLFMAVILPKIAFLAGDVRYSIPGLTNRFTGVVGDANSLGFICDVLIAISLALRPRYWQLDVLAVTVTLALSQSNYAIWLAVTVFLIYRLRVWRMAAARALLYCAPFLYLGTTLFGIFTPISSQVLHGLDPLDSRPLIWRWALRNWETAPKMGFGQSGLANLLHFDGVYWVHIHNEFLQDLLVGGPIRAIGICLVIGCMWFQAKFALSEGDPLPAMAVSLLIIYCSIEIPLYFDSINFRVFTAMVITGICFSRPRSAVRKK